MYPHNYISQETAGLCFPDYGSSSGKWCANKKIKIDPVSFYGSGLILSGKDYFKKSFKNSDNKFEDFLVEFYATGDKYKIDFTKNNQSNFSIERIGDYATGGFLIDYRGTKSYATESIIGGDYISSDNFLANNLIGKASGVLKYRDTRIKTENGYFESGINLNINNTIIYTGNSVASVDNSGILKFNLDSFTIDFLFKFTGDQNSNFDILSIRTDSGSANYPGRNNQNSLTFIKDYISNAITLCKFSSNTILTIPYTSGIWNNIAITCNKVGNYYNFSGYKNGILQDYRNVLSGSYNYANDLIFSGLDISKNIYNAQIAGYSLDEFRMWSGAKSSGEINNLKFKELNSDPALINDPNLLYYIPFNPIEKPFSYSFSETGYQNGTVQSATGLYSFNVTNELVQQNNGILPGKSKGKIEIINFEYYSETGFFNQGIEIYHKSNQYLGYSPIKISGSGNFEKVNLDSFTIDFLFKHDSVYSPTKVYPSFYSNGISYTSGVAYESEVQFLNTRTNNNNYLYQYLYTRTGIRFKSFVSVSTEPYYLYRSYLTSYPNTYYYNVNATYYRKKVTTTKWNYTETGAGETVGYGETLLESFPVSYTFSENWVGTRIITETADGPPTEDFNASYTYQSSLSCETNHDGDVKTQSIFVSSDIASIYNKTISVGCYESTEVYTKTGDYYAYNNYKEVVDHPEYGTTTVQYFDEIGGGIDSIDKVLISDNSSLLALEVWDQYLAGTVFYYKNMISVSYNQYGDKLVLPVPIDRNWHHISVTLNRMGTGNFFSGYVDGQLVSSGSAPYTGPLEMSGIDFSNYPLGENDLYHSLGKDYYDISIDEFRFWSGAKTSAEINNLKFKELNSNPVLLNDPNLLYYSSFDLLFLHNKNIDFYKNGEFLDRQTIYNQNISYLDFKNAKLTGTCEFDEFRFWSGIRTSGEISGNAKSGIGDILFPTFSGGNYGKINGNMIVEIPSMIKNSGYFESGFVIDSQSYNGGIYETTRSGVSVFGDTVTSKQYTFDFLIKTNKDLFYFDTCFFLTNSHKSDSNSLLKTFVFYWENNPSSISFGPSDNNLQSISLPYKLSFSTDIWNHICITMNQVGSNWLISGYINGLYKGSAQTLPSTNYFGSDFNFSGITFYQAGYSFIENNRLFLDEFRAWSGIKSSGEINQLKFQRLSSKVEWMNDPDLLLYVPFEKSAVKTSFIDINALSDYQNSGLYSYPLI